VGYLLFLIGLTALVLLCWRVPMLWRLQGFDGCAAGLLVAFAALSLSATVLSIFGVLTGVTWVAALAVMAGGALVAKSPAGSDRPGLGFSSGQLMLLLLPAVLVGYAQFVSPVSKFDDLMYHGSRAGYWLGNQSVFPFATHNERQAVFPYAGDLLFAFGVFTARSELLGRMLVFLSYPLTLILVAGMLRGRAVPVGLAIGAAWVVGVTPLVRDAGIGIKPDLWGAVFALIAVNAVWSYLDRSSSLRERGAHAIVLLGAVCAAIAVKFTFLLLAPLAAVALLRPAPLRVRALWLATIPCWVVTFGLVFTVIHSRIHEGGWLGSPELTSTMRGPDSADGILRHLARLPFVIVGMPVILTEGLRQTTEDTLRAAADRLGATVPLPLESADEPWPGLFVPTVPRVNYTFSLLWAFAIVALVAAVVRWRRLVSSSDGRMALLTLAIGAVFIVAAACTVRWQTYSAVPERLLVPGMVIAMVGVAWVWYLVLSGYRVFVALAVAMAVLHVLPFANLTRLSLVVSQKEIAARAYQREPLGRAAPVVEPGSRVLLVAGQAATDYLLFHPWAGFPTRVFPWGRKPFAEEAFAAALKETSADTVVLESSDRLSYHWHPDVPAGPFLDFLDGQGGFHRVSAGESTVLYVRRKPVEHEPGGYGRGYGVGVPR
jgi:hypothetical protein